MGGLLREVGKRIGLTPRIAKYCADHRHALRVEHRAEVLAAQHMHALALSCENLHDQAALRGEAEIWLDLDTTDDPLHGPQEGRFLPGHCGCHGYWPLGVFCGEHLPGARLRPRTGRPRQAASRSSGGWWGSCAATGPDTDPHPG